MWGSILICTVLICILMCTVLIYIDLHCFDMYIDLYCTDLYWSVLTCIMTGLGTCPLWRRFWQARRITWSVMITRWWMTLVRIGNSFICCAVIVVLWCVWFIFVVVRFCKLSFVPLVSPWYYRLSIWIKQLVVFNVSSIVGQIFIVRNVL